jgi:hypothetical protein
MSQGAAGDVFFERDVVEHEAWREAPGRFAPPHQLTLKLSRVGPLRCCSLLPRLPACAKNRRPAPSVAPGDAFVKVREGAPEARRKNATEARSRPCISANIRPFFAQQKTADSAESRLSNGCVFVEFRAKKRARTRSTIVCEKI